MAKQRVINKSTPGRMIILGFVAVILVGALLLMLPVSSADGKSASFLDSLFTATSATCVTGLIVRDTGTGWSVFGQTVILLMIQIGGLGFMTVAGFLRILLFKGNKFSDREAVLQGLNIDYISDIKHMLRFVAKVTFGCEGVAALLLFFRFVTQMSVGKAVYASVFHAVSAFCNAGFDIMGNFSSLTSYADDLYVNIIIMALITMGGLGYLVWMELLEHKKNKKISPYTKMVLITSAVLLVGGALLFALFEWNNPATIGKMTVGDKILASFFQSVTFRTAGFNTVDLSAITRLTVLMSCLLMFVGGSSGSTAGGIKTGTFAIVMLTVRNILRGRSEIVIFNRRINRNTIYRAFTIVVVGILILILSVVLLSYTEDAPLSCIMFECVSAFGTVGVTMGITTALSAIGKILLILLMFMGRLGILTLSCSIASQLKNEENLVEYLDAKMLVG